MSESWANKYRPKKISEVIGQPRVKRELEVLNKVGSLPRAILLSGSSGSGKTTLAYLIAKMGKCPNLSEDGVPCDTCPNCLNIDKLIEKQVAPVDLEVYLYNISKLNRSEDAEEIVEKMSQRNSMLNNKRYFILDEIQVASQQAQARFLKVTEEQPKGLYTILCTTNPEKLSEPLLSRFVNYKLTKPKTSEIVDKLADICTKEGVDYTKSGLTLIVNYCDRSVRKSINKAEELSAFGELSKGNVSSRLNQVSEEHYFNFIQAISRNNLVTISNIFQYIDDEGLTVSDFAESFGRFLVDLIEITNLLHNDLYTKDEIKFYKRKMEMLDTEEIICLLTKSKEYSVFKTSSKFLFFSYATELMSAFNRIHLEKEEREKGNIPEGAEVVQRPLPEVSEDVVAKRYVDLTKEIAESDKDETVIENVIPAEDLAGFFTGVEIELLPK